MYKITSKRHCLYCKCVSVYECIVKKCLYRDDRLVIVVETREKRHLYCKCVVIVVETRE